MEGIWAEAMRSLSLSISSFSLPLLYLSGFKLCFVFQFLRPFPSCHLAGYKGKYRHVLVTCFYLENLFQNIREEFFFLNP